jgi:hypothetical protein
LEKRKDFKNGVDHELEISHIVLGDENCKLLSRATIKISRETELQTIRVASISFVPETITHTLL